MPPGWSGRTRRGQADCYRSLLQDPNGDGIYTFVTGSIPPGEYEATGILPGEAPAVPFTLTEGQAVLFTYNPEAGTLETTIGNASEMVSSAAAPTGLPAPAAPKPNTVTIPGTIQSVLGCPGDWLPDCDLTYLPFDEEDQLWTATFTIPAGDYEYKAALNDTWDVNFGLNAEPGGANIPLSLAEETAVTFFFDHNTGWVADSVNNLIANVPGSFQAAIGCPEDWQPACLRSWLQDPDGDGTFVYMTDEIPAGDYEAKVAINQNWGENYGENGAQDGANIPFSVPADNTPMVFSYDSASHVLTIVLWEKEPPRGTSNSKRLIGFPKTPSPGISKQPKATPTCSTTPPLAAHSAWGWIVSRVELTCLSALIPMASALRSRPNSPIWPAIPLSPSAPMI